MSSPQDQNREQILGALRRALKRGEGDGAAAAEVEQRLAGHPRNLVLTLRELSHFYDASLAPHHRAPVRLRQPRRLRPVTAGRRQLPPRGRTLRGAVGACQIGGPPLRDDLSDGTSDLLGP